jgi:transposase
MLTVCEPCGIAYECLRKRHLDVRLSNPAKTRAIASAKIKTDKLNSIKLANLLRGGYIAECYIPTKETMDLRELVTHRAALVPWLYLQRYLYLILVTSKERWQNIGQIQAQIGQHISMH